MKIFTEKIKYGLAALFELAKNSFKEHLQIKEISLNQNIPHNYLEKLLIDLKRADLVESIRGAQGGYKLNKSPDKINLLEIIEALEGPITFFDYSESAEVLQQFWGNIEKNFKDLFNQTLEDLIENEKKLMNNQYFDI